jgi:hypothetical protein|tara:strand:- start:1179 stop:1595 length:417 start_codon:yes stop_codon:yes gene_type:complete
MAAGRYSFVIEQGATTDFEVIYNDSTGNPIDLTGYSARMSIRQSQISTSQLYITLSSSLGPCGTGLNLSGSQTSAGYPHPLSSGSIGIYISAASSSVLSFNEGYYDLELMSGSGDCTTVTRLLMGAVRLSNEITIGSF